MIKENVLKSLDWNGLQAFMTAAKAGSFSKAARLMGVTQPTLSRQIYALEQDLGVTLFERLSTGLALTRSGEHLLTFVQPMGVNAEQVLLAIAGLADQSSAPVTISVSELDALFRLPDFIVFCQQRFPDIELDVQVSHTVSDLKRRESDIALRSFRPTEGDLIARKVGDEPIWFYGTKAHLEKLAEKNPSPQRPSDLVGLEIIGFERDHELTARLAKMGWPIEQPRFPVTTLSQGLQWELVKKGVGLGIFPQQIGDNEPIIERAFEYLGPPMTIPLWLVTHRELHTNLRIRQVFDALGEWLTRTP